MDDDALRSSECYRIHNISDRKEDESRKKVQTIVRDTVSASRTVRWSCYRLFQKVKQNQAPGCLIVPIELKLQLLQRLHWSCVECAIHHERDVREEQHPYICGVNKQ